GEDLARAGFGHSYDVFEFHEVVEFGLLFGSAGVFFIAVDALGDASLGFGGGLKVGDGFRRGAGRDEVDDFEVHGARRAHLVFSIQRKMRAVRILGIESSCDETAAAVVEDGSRILSSVVASQIATHARYGGVVPELASREHLRAIVPVVRLALEQSATRLEELGAIAVTQGPGLGGSPLVGNTYAHALAIVRQRR